MLQELVIQNVAIIEQVEVTFHSGLSAFTGETGAGKSIIMDALGLLIGNRGRSELVRTGSSKAIVQGQFSLEAVNQSQIKQLCQQQGVDLPIADPTLIIKRELHKNGRNLCRVNGTLVPLAFLKKLGPYLVDISGQNQSQSLLDPQTHLHLLDEFGQKPLQQTLAAYQKEFAKYQQIRQQLAEVQHNQQQLAQQRDMLQFQVQEITAANLQPQEEEELTSQLQQLTNFEKIHESLATAYLDLAQRTPSIMDRLGEVLQQMQTISDYDPEYQEITHEIESSFYDLQDSQERIRQQLDQQEYEPGKVDELQTRLQLIRNLEKKYGASISEVLTFGQQAQTKLIQLEQQLQDPQQLEQQLQTQTSVVQQKAQRLSQQRHQAARQLEQKIQEQLAAMYMDQTRFQIQFTTTNFTRWGQESLEFFLQANPGEELLPLAKIASGGELSRIMLALKTVLAQYQAVETLVFDEIDTGVSGRVAQAIGEKLAQIATQVQVLCITHLPQVAAVSDTQYLVDKQVQKKHTVTTVQTLSPQQRVAVIAQMLEGTKVTTITKQHAQELLQLAHPTLTFAKSDQGQQTLT